MIDSVLLIRARKNETNEWWWPVAKDAIFYQNGNLRTPTSDKWNIWISVLYDSEPDGHFTNLSDQKSRNRLIEFHASPEPTRCNLLQHTIHQPLNFTVRVIIITQNSYFTPTRTKNKLHQIYDSVLGNKLWPPVPKQMISFMINSCFNDQIRVLKYPN